MHFIPFRGSLKATKVIERPLFKIVLQTKANLILATEYFEEIEIKEVEKSIYNYEQDSDFSKELDLNLLAKVATNLKIKYEDIKIDESNSIRFNDKISFLVITYLAEKDKVSEEDLGNYFEKKILFVNKSNGKIIDQYLDKNLCYYDNEAGQPGKTYIFNKLIQQDESTYAIGVLTEFDSGSSITLWSQQKLTIVTLVDNKIKKLLYEYPIRKTQGSSNSAGSFEMETLETVINVSNKKTNGFFDLKIVKFFSYEEEIEEDLEKGIKAQVAPIKTKKETERIQYNGENYSFKIDDRYRFL